jgi:hypothetical protein
MVGRHPCPACLTYADVRAFSRGLAVQPIESARNMRVTRVLPAYSVPYLMEWHGMQHIDYLKIDIETGERYLFSAKSLATGWLATVTCVSIELHEHFEPGCCTKPFHDAMTQYDFTWRLNTTELTVFCKREHNQ